MNFFKHLRTINHHRRLVRKYCFKCGLIYQGLVHDLSKYSYGEFRNGCKYYRGTGSPHYKERTDKGYSEAWMHHKGRNKHHCEYWSDFTYDTRLYEPVKMPRKYVAEMFCDRIAASKTYNPKTYTNEFPLNYFYREIDYLPIHAETSKELEMLLRMLKDRGEKETFRYIKKEYLKGDKK